MNCLLFDHLRNCKLKGKSIGWWHLHLNGKIMQYSSALCWKVVFLFVAMEKNTTNWTKEKYSRACVCVLSSSSCKGHFRYGFHSILWAAIICFILFQYFLLSLFDSSIRSCFVTSLTNFRWLFDANNQKTQPHHNRNIIHGYQNC